MRVISLPMRLDQDAEDPSEIPIALIKITHPDFPEPIRLCSSWTERISEEPLIYGTYSTWLTDDASPFKCVVIGVQPPDETQQGFGEGAIVVGALSSAIFEALTSTTKPATIDLAMVRTQSPNFVEWQSRRMRTRSAGGDGGQVRIGFSRWPFRREAWPPHSFNPANYPALFR